MRFVLTNALERPRVCVTIFLVNMKFFCIVVTSMAVCLFQFVAIAQSPALDVLTAKQWEELNNVDSKAATEIIIKTFVKAEAEAEAEYLARNDEARAARVRTLIPNAVEVTGRLGLAAAVKPNLTIREVLLKYIVDATAEAK